jgi:GNAT superfamily N-acetyltransferase
MDMQEVARRILRQRMSRFQDAGPSLGVLGTARFRVEPGLLSVAYAAVVPRGAAEAVYRVVDFARHHRMHVQWVVVPMRPGEEELPAALRAASFAFVEDLLLMAHVGRIHPTTPLPNNVTVAHIASWQAMWQYEYGSRQSFYNESRPAEAVVTQRATERWREHERGWCRYYAAFSGEQYVGGCYVSLYEDVPTLMGVYTLPEARRRGVARTLLTRVVNEIAMMRNDLCCLYVERGNPAERLYQSLGFVPLFNTQTYSSS